MSREACTAAGFRARGAGESPTEAETIESEKRTAQQAPSRALSDVA